MRAPLLTVAILLFTSLTLHAQTTTRPCEAAGVRPTRSWIARLLHDHLERSPTLHRLVDQVTASSSIVHVADDVGSRDWDGRFRFVALSGACRYVRVDIRYFAATPERSAAVLAHELQHVLEADRGGVVDQPTLARLFQRIGFASLGPAEGTFDTTDAVSAGLQALRELTGKAVNLPTATASALAAGDGRRGGGQRR